MEPASKKQKQEGNAVTSTIKRSLHVNPIFTSKSTLIVTEEDEKQFIYDLDPESRNKLWRCESFEQFGCPSTLTLSPNAINLRDQHSIRCRNKQEKCFLLRALDSKLNGRAARQLTSKIIPPNEFRKIEEAIADWVEAGKVRTTCKSFKVVKIFGLKGVENLGENSKPKLPASVGTGKLALLQGAQNDELFELLDKGLKGNPDGISLTSFSTKAARKTSLTPDDNKIDLGFFLVVGIPKVHKYKIRGRKDDKVIWSHDQKTGHFTSSKTVTFNGIKFSVPSDPQGATNTMERLEEYSLQNEYRKSAQIIAIVVIQKCSV